MPPVRHRVRASRALQLRHPLSPPARPGRAAAAVAVVALVLAAALLHPGVGRADGDPASDVLLTENLFLPYSPAVTPSVAAQLNLTITRAHDAGFPIKVALIESQADLGAVPQLFAHPQRYARFLDIEISYSSTAKLLVVMPQGFGLAAAGPPAAVARIPVDAAARSDGLARAAIRAVVALAGRAGARIASPLPLDAAGGGTRWPLIVAAIVVVLAATGSTFVVRRRLASRRAPGPLSG